MPELSLVLFDDDTSCAWQPFALTRPGGELRFGALTQRARVERVFGGRCVAHLGPDHLLGFSEPGAAPVRRYGDAPADGDRLFLSARLVPAWGAGDVWRERRGGAGALVVAGEVVGWFAPEGTAAPEPSFFASPRQLLDRTGAVEVDGRLLEAVWELMSGTPAQVAQDVAALFPDAAPAALPAGAYRLGDGALVLGHGAEVEPGAVIDTRGGPVWLDEGARVRAFTRLAGPAYVGRRSQLLGGSVEAVSIGDVCRIRGEFAESVCLVVGQQGARRPHGARVPGRWVNLGAETTNSDLKNNYGTIRLWTPEGEVDTGDQAGLPPRRPREDGDRPAAQHRHGDRCRQQPVSAPPCRRATCPRSAGGRERS
jgi:UDP-N-acetylglucosamine diphosphorylase / glucose-1-phosphate thymidylyltransferase / UDP-N-acetylgalactosamine diphosphorylase / glucosamine-1-phosphate N-acetyltransferase / galactosamine-1-phosphate N-acetyltransferase